MDYYKDILKRQLDTPRSADSTISPPKSAPAQTIYRFSMVDKECLYVFLGRFFRREESSRYVEEFLTVEMSLLRVFENRVLHKTRNGVSIHKNTDHEIKIEPNVKRDELMSLKI